MIGYNLKEDFQMLDRTKIINHLIQKNNYKSYLEIGVQTGMHFKNIKCAKKVGVDPDSRARATHVLTSNNFFAQNKDFFDIIFIDGLHWYEQVYKDFTNSLLFLNEGGRILFHDFLPTHKAHQLRHQVFPAWNGDSWKAIAPIRKNFSETCEIYTVDCDEGTAVLKRGCMEKIIIKNEELNWKNFVKKKKEWMNIISPEEFYEIER